MKKILFFLLALLILLPLHAAAVSIEYTNEDISGALTILREKRRFRRGACCGSRIDFSEEDFIGVYGEKEFDSIRVLRLPEKDLGRLVLNGQEVEAGQSIPKSKISSLSFLPSDPEPLETTFTFRSNTDKTEQVCYLILGEQMDSRPKGGLVQIQTHKNVACYFSIETETFCGNGEVRIEKGAKNGWIEALEGNRFLYRPKTNYSGTDSFTYRVIDSYGNQSSEIRGSISIEKAKGNLFFVDLVESTIHNDALTVVTKGLMEYQRDERGLPVFSYEDPVYESDLMASVYKTLGLKKERETDTAVSTSLPVTKSEALSVMEYYFQYEDDGAESVFHPEESEANLTRGELAQILVKVLDY